MPTTGAPSTISAADTADPNATIIRVNISGGLTAASVFTDINAALAASGIGLKSTLRREHLALPRRRAREHDPT